MKTVINLRGTNGSGKSTIARHFIGSPQQPVDLNAYDAPTKKDPARRLRVTGYIRSDGVGVVGPYHTACGGLDAVPSFPIQLGAIRVMAEKFPVHSIIAEGVLASTVFGSWAEFAKGFNETGGRFAWVYLQTPLEVCLERIRARQAAAGNEREIKEDLVADKIKAISATRAKAIKAGFAVYDLPFGDEIAAVTRIIGGQGGQYLA